MTYIAIVFIGALVIGLAPRVAPDITSRAGMAVAAIVAVAMVFAWAHE